MTKLCPHSLMSKSATFLSQLTSVKMFKHLRGVDTFVFFLTCSLEANRSCVPLGEMLDIGALDPARLPQRESKNDYVDLVSRSHEADDSVWVGHNEALDRTTSAMGKILLANMKHCLWCFTLLMNLHDFATEPFNPEHIFRDARTVPFCLTADHMMSSARFKTAQFWSLWTRGEWKCGICSYQRRRNQHPCSPMEKWYGDLSAPME